MRRSDIAAFVILSCAGFLAGHLALGCRRPEPLLGEVGIHVEPFRMTRSAGDPFFVTESSWLELPMLREDFDLMADVELSEGAELDIVLRRVEPRPLQGVSLPAHGRFVSLRLSTKQDGAPWRLPTAALLGEPGGARIGAGLPASVQVKARGRTLSGSVAYKPLPEVAAQDDHGSLALIARGGSVAIRTLHVLPVPRANELSPRWLGLAVGAALGALAAALRRGPVRALLAGAGLVSASFAFCLAVAPCLLPLTQPDAFQEQSASLLGIPLALAFVFASAQRTKALCLVAVGLVSTALWSSIVVDGIRSRFPATPELDAVFGESARETVVETLAQRVRGPSSIHTKSALEQGQSRVFLLGGQLLWRRGAAPSDHVEPMLAGELRGEDPKRPAVEVVTLPTEDGFASQQWGMFSRFFRGFAPAVVVLGVPRDEDAHDRSGAPRSSPDALRRTIAEAKSGCAEIGAKLVLLADNGLSEPFLAVLRSERDAGLELVEVTDNDAALGIARKLAAALRPLLQK